MKAGKCKRRGCGKPVRPKLNPAVKGTALRARLLVDPYCSTECAKAAHGVEMPLPGHYKRDYTERSVA